jgi:hypothetical protein
MGMQKVVAAGALTTMMNEDRQHLKRRNWCKISVVDPHMLYSGSGPSFLPQSGSGPRRDKSKRIHADPDPQIRIKCPLSACYG